MPNVKKCTSFTWLTIKVLPGRYYMHDNNHVTICMAFKSVAICNAIIVCYSILLHISQHIQTNMS